MSIYQSYDLVDSVKAAYGFDPRQVYCLVTGKPIGSLFADDFDLTAANLSPTLEEARDDIAFRALASMRPSMRWNRLRLTSIETLRRQVPCEVMAYMLNRLFEPTKESKVPVYLDVHRDRIYTWQWIEKQQWTYAEQFNSLLLALLELDVKLGLKQESAPITCKEMLGETIVDFHRAIAKWIKQRIDYHTKCELDAKFFAANPNARKAYFGAWMAAKTPDQIAAEKTKATKQRDANFLDAILAEIMLPDSGVEKPAAMRPIESEIASAKSVAPSSIRSTKMPNWMKAVGQ